jgi:hypothetical protein
MFKKHPLAILNTAICTVPGDYEVSTLSLEQARGLVAEASEILSAVGHQATADVLTQLLGREVPVNRILFQQQPGQQALVLKMRGRPPEGVVFDVAAMEAMGYDLWLMTRRRVAMSQIRADMDRCEHGRHSRHGRGHPDPCFGCPGGISAGNPVPNHLVVGHRVHGEPITVAGLLTGDAHGLPALVDEIKALLSVDRGADDPVTNGEVAEHLPEEFHSEFWRGALERYFATELDGLS